MNPSVRTTYRILIELENNQEAQQGIEAIGTAAGLSGAALLAFSGAAAKAAIDYETSLAAVSTVASDTTGTVGEFDEALLSLSNAMGGQLSVAQGATTAYQVLSAGYSDQADILKILELAQKTAIGGFSDLNTISSAATTIMNAYGDALGENLTVTEKMTLITDQMIQTQNAGDIVAGEYAQQIGIVASTAAIAGVSFEELNAAIAVSTSAGLSVGNTMAGLNQIIATISDVTPEAAEEAERLGIAFDAATLKTKGLGHIMNEIVQSGGATSETMFKLFGSVEAVRVAMTLVPGEGARFQEAIGGMTNATGVMNSAFETMSDTTAAQAQAALNKLSNTIIRLGQGVLIAIEPAIEALDFLITAVSKLPVEFQQAIGFFAVFGGLAATAAGGFLTLATGALELRRGLSEALLILNKFTLSMTSLHKVNFASIALGLKNIGLAAQAAAPMLIAAAGAIAAVALAVKQYQNIEKELANLDQQGLLKETQLLADKTSTLVFKLQETGKAMPEAEFVQWISLLKEADGSTGVLQGQIDGLIKAQVAAGGATGGLVDTTEADIAVTEAQAQSKEAAAKAFEEYTDRVQATIRVLDTQRQTELAYLEASGASEEEVLRKRLDINGHYNQQILDQQRALASQSSLSAQERAQLEAEIGQQIANETKEIFEAQKRLQELNEQRVLDGLETQQIRAEQLFASKKLLETEYISELQGILQDELNVRLATIDESLKGAEEGSAQEAELLRDRAQAELEYTQEVIALDEQRTRATLDAAQEEFDITSSNLERSRLAFEELYDTRAISEAEYDQLFRGYLQSQYEASLEHLNEQLSLAEVGSAEEARLLHERAELGRQLNVALRDSDQERFDAYLEGVEQTITLEQDLFRESIEARRVGLDQLNNQDAIAGGLEGVLGRVSSLLKDDNTTLSQREQLTKLTRNMVVELADLGVRVNVNLTAEQQIQQALAQLEMAKLAIKQEQLAVTRELLIAEAQAAQMELQGGTEVAALQLANPNLGDAERRALEDEITLNQKKLDVLNKQTAAKLRANEISQEILSFEQRLAQIQAQTPTEAGGAGLSEREARGVTRRVSGSAGRADSSNSQRLTQASESTAQNTQTIAQAIGAQTQATQSLAQANQNNTQMLQSHLTALQSIGTTTQNISRQLSAIGTQLTNLPRQIAASIPRPAPAPARAAR